MEGVDQPYLRSNRSRRRRCGEVGADDLLGLRENFIESHGGGVEDCGIRSGLEGGLGAVTVAIVTLPHFIDDGSFR